MKRDRNAYRYAIGLAIATALVQAVIGAIALIRGLGYPASSPLELVGLNGMFIVLFIGSALLFRRAERA